MGRGKQEQASSLVFLYRFNQLYPGRQNFQGFRIRGSGIEYLPFDECKLRGKTHSQK